MKNMDEMRRGQAALFRLAPGRHRLMMNVGVAALALASVFPSMASARDYTAATDAELRQAILDANADGDATSTITLTGNIAIGGSLPNSTKPLVINTGAFSTNGMALTGIVTVIGTVNGNDDMLTGNGQAGLRLITFGGLSTTVTNNATVTGGDGTNSSADGLGAEIQQNGNLINNGSITGGSSGGPGSLNGGYGIQMTGTASVVNNGLIQGGTGIGVTGGRGAFIGVNPSALQTFTNNATGVVRGGDATGGALGGVGIYVNLIRTPIVNHGLIEGGNGAAAIVSRPEVNIINDGIIRAGAGGTVAIDATLSPLTLLELRAGSSITGLVLANPGAAFAQTIQLGGTVNASFDMSSVGAAAQYRNFNRFTKVGTSSWTLTGNTSGMPVSIWEIQQGTLVFDDTATGQTSAILGNGALIFQQDGALSVGNLNGAISVLQNGPGTTTLVGNTHSSGTTLAGGKLSIGTEAALGSSAFTITGGALQWTGNGNIARAINWGTNGAEIEVTGTALTFDQPLLGGGALTKSGAGVLVLNGDNSYTGGTTISAGTLRLNGSILGNVLNNGTLIFGNATPYTYAGSITGSGDVSVVGAGLLTLTGNSNFGGTLTVNNFNGGLNITGGANVVWGGATTHSNGQFLVNAGSTATSGGATAIGSTSNTPTTLTVDGTGSSFSTTSINASASLNRNITVSVTNGGRLTTTTGDLNIRAATISAASSNTGQLVVDGAGSLADVAGGLVVANSNITNGKLMISGGGTLRTAGANIIGFATGNTRGVPTATITGTGSNWTSTNSLVMSNGSFTLEQGGTTSFTNATFGTAPLGATLTVAGAGSKLTTTTGDLVIGSGAGTGQLTLSDGGAVDVAGSLILADSGTATGILSIGGGEGLAAAAVGAFTAPTLTLGSATSRLNFNHTGTDYLFASAISGAGAINQVAGVTNLTGNSAGFTGTTTVSGGRLRVNGTLGNIASVVNVGSGARLGGAGTIGGSVNVTDGVLAPGNSPGTLIIAGNLGQTSASLLDFEFGQSDVTGGPLNDLIEVGGNLTLDGTIDVTVTPGGEFDVGVYRIIKYGGALTNNGLTLGTMPAGSIPQIQTAVAGQVNLVNFAGAAVNFWDGNGGRGDGTITGGNGVWQAAGGNDNWTLVDGTLNNVYSDGNFAVFMGAAGAVMVNNSLGAVNASGMQFARDGYIITGGALGLTAPQAIIRVGDGTAAGAGYTATILSAMNGIGDLVKTDLGTLVLVGMNSFSGEVIARTGALRIANGGRLGGLSGTIGRDSTDRAVVTVTGTDGVGNASTWTSGDLTVGNSGTGTLNITAGGKVVSGDGFVSRDTGAVGQVLVSGTGSLWDSSGRVGVGSGGAGNLRIEAGGRVSSADGVVGSSSHGDAVVTGAGSLWANTGQLSVGSFGTGSLRIEDGASVTSNQGYVGANADGTVTVTGAGSNWLVGPFNITVGNFANGTLTIENDGRVRSDGGVYLGGDASASGTLVLQGTAANRAVLETSGIRRGAGGVSVSIDGGLLRATSNNNSFFANFGTNDVMLGTNGVVVDTAGRVIGISPRFVGAGGLTKDGAGTLKLTGANSYSGATFVNAGTLLVSGDQSAATGLTTVLAGATLGGNGIIGGNVDILGGAILAPGENPGALTVNGNLSLASGSILAYEFGQANVAGGALNDLVNVGGDLTLDGTINVSVSAGGTFGPGVYRVFNYGGALADNGLTLGTIAGGAAGISVQTAVAGQVNLVNSAGLTLGFWDGVAGPKNNGAVNGGDGVWRVAGGSNNWTDANGTINADYAQDSFAIFSAAPGAVTIDNSGGNVLASGMQFASDGYVLSGDALTLTRAQATIQVGDGSVAGAGYTATVAAELTGAAGLVKTDAGRLVLTGVNSYTGGTRIEGGTLQIGNGGATGRIGGDIVNNAALVVDRSGTILLDGAISGTGSLTKRGSGLLELTGVNGYAGGTLVDSGIVRVSSDANLGAAAGVLSLQSGTLQAGASFASGRAILVGSADSNAIDTQGFDVTLGGVIGNGPGNSAGNFLDKRGTGTLTLTGANSYSNRTVLGAGTLALAGAGTIGAGDLTVGSGTIFDISQTNTGARVIQLGGAADGTVVLGSKTLTLGFANSFTDWAGTIADGGIGGGTGGKVVVSAFGGAVRYFGATSYTGGTTVAGGSFELVGNGSLHSAGAVTVNGGALFNIGGLTAAGTTIGDLSGAGAVFLGGKTLTFGAANDTALTGPVSGNGGGLIKQGAGTFTLAGANSYTGATDILAGTLLVNGNQSAATGLTSVASGATLGGAGVIGGNVIVANGATLAPGADGPGALTINGNLTLASDATLGFEFGRANDVGGPLNDVVNVGGDLILDGTLDVAVPAGGAFDIGLYRVINYGGSLTDNGLTLGTMPAGANTRVQTSIAGEVNLINRGSATLNFWDGAAGPKFDGAVSGGDGMWQNSLGNDNWADITGAVNAGYDDGAFAIFSGTAGTVTIDNSLGAVRASGMQFATGGYVIAGDALTLDGVQAVIRVGDGSAAGAAYVATIDAELTGAAGLVKADAGMLILTGANSYAGGTSINGGTLQVGGNASLGATGGALSFDGGILQTTGSFTSARGVELVGAGGFRTDAGTTLMLSGTLSGAGTFAKSGGGTLVLGGSGFFGGATVGGGTLLVNGNYAAATGTTNVLAGTTLGGAGTIGGNVAIGNGATLAPGSVAGAAGTLTIGGNLSLSATSQLDFEFGEAGAVGGALNDLVNVGGNLLLDGVLNVGVPTGGAFNVGVYRMFNYGGTLTDNGVTLGTLPAGANANVQTSIAGQVNLVNAAGLTLNFWDGAAGPKNNGTINGGSGVWQASGGNDNWTGANGAVNAAYSDGAFAIFGGTGGAVTVDNSLGAVSVAGMQFAANNYVIGGGNIALADPTATIRVGDGSAAGGGFTATINSALSGGAQLVKSDAGTLVLGGMNSYAGGTLITGGTLRISSDGNLGAASGNLTLDGGTLETSANMTSARETIVVSGGTIATAAGTVFTHDGLFSSAGTLTKNGAGTLLVTANSSGFGGSTAVAGGTLAVRGSLGGAVTVGSAGRLEGTGRVGSIANAGVVAPGASIGTLTVAGNYAGNGGVLEIEAELGGDASAADRLVVNGATSGTTAVTVINRGGLGAQTVEGIKIVDVAGVSNGSFILDGDYLFEGQQAVIAGAYGYRLYKNGVATPQDGDWYLRSSLLNPTQPENPGPLYQPGVPVYEAYVGALQSLNRLPTLQQRVGNRSWAASPIAGAGLWGRFESERQRPEALVSSSGADRKVDQWQVQLGLDAVLAQRSDGASLAGGLTAHYGKADSSVASIFGNGTIDTQGYGVGATMTWYGPKGFYVDGQVKLSWFDSDLESNILGSLARGNKGDGQAFSLELGKQTSIGRNLSITPQVQMSYAKVDFDRFADPSNAAVSVARGESLKTRWGLAIDHQTSWKGRSGDTRRTRLYTVMNLSYEWLDGAEADVSGTPIANRDHRLSGELGLGGSYSWGDDRFTLYTEVSGDTAIADFVAGYSLKGTAGFRVRF